ncbi:MAG: hypothetical protein JW742_07520 [Candidatus Aminicenantes bacterium]|nr:hypothetical protein [Candidatus Aminicenantes bacterium]
MARIEASSSWPGFAPDAVPAAVFDGAKTYLFDHPRPPLDFKPIEGSDRVRVFEGRYGGVDAKAKVRIGETWVAACRTARPVGDPGSGQAFTMRALAEVILQQKFQIFLARRHPDWVPDPAHQLVYPPDNDRTLTLRRVELAALRRAVEAEADEDAASWAAEGLKHHVQRLGLLDAKTVRYERDLERFEGIAEFMKCAASGGPAARLADVIAAEPAGGDGVPEGCIRTGCLISYLLERFVPDWKERLDSGAIDDLERELAGAIAAYPPKPTFSITELIKIRRKAEDDLAARNAARDSLFQEFLTRAGYRVEIITEEDPLRPVSIDCGGLVRLTANESLHRGPLTFKNDSATLEILGGALSVHRGTPGAVRVLATGLADKPAIVKGRGRNQGVIVLRTEGWTLIGRGFKVIESGTALTVILPGPPR